MWLLDMCCLLRLQSARAELEEQLSVAIEDAKELATEAVSKPRQQRRLSLQGENFRCSPKL